MTNKGPIDSVINIFETNQRFKTLCSSLHMYSDKLFSITEQELCFILEYDVLNIMALFYRRVNRPQKKYILDSIQSVMGLNIIASVLDNLSEFIEEDVFMPLSIRLFNRTGILYTIRAAYEIIFSQCAEIVKDNQKNDSYVYENLLLMDVAYFFILAEGVGIPDSYSQCMKSCFGQSNYDDLVEFLFEKYSGNDDWDADINLDRIETFIEKNSNILLLQNDTIEQEDQEPIITEYLDVIDIVAGFHGLNLKKIRIKYNIDNIQEIRKRTSLSKVGGAIIDGFDCRIYSSEKFEEEYVIILQRLTTFRQLAYDDILRKSFLETIYKIIQKFCNRTDAVYILFLKNKTDSSYPEQPLICDTSFCPKFIFSIDEAISFLLGIHERTSDNQANNDEVRSDSIHLSKQENLSEDTDRYIWPCIDDTEYGLYLVENGWIYDELYVPYIKVIIVNHTQKSIANSTIKAVFYEKKPRKLWAEDTDTIDDDGNELFSGVLHASCLKADQGYENKISEMSLPNIYAEIFMDDDLLGQVVINRSYEQNHKLVPIFKDYCIIEDIDYIRKTPNPFYPVISAAYWKKSNDLYVPFIKIDVINQEDVPAHSITVTAVFYQIRLKNLWSVSTSYIITEEDTPLKQGYRKTAFLEASKGLVNEVEKYDLPEITVEIYINNQFYGTALVECSYHPYALESSLNENPVEIDNDYVRFDHKDFYPVVKQKHWVKNSDVYVPFLQLDITNQQEVPVYDLDIDVLFYHTSNNALFCEGEESALSDNIPLRPGFNKSSFIRGQQGYEEIIDEAYLPSIKAYVYINSDYYGSVIVNKTYDGNMVTESLLSEEKEDKQNNESNVWNEKSFLGEMGYSTHKSQNERQAILYKAIILYGKQRIIDHISFLIRMRMMQENGSVKYQKAISRWKEDLIFVRKQ